MPELGAVVVTIMPPYIQCTFNVNNAMLSGENCFEAYRLNFGKLPTLLRRKLIDFLQRFSKVTNFIYFYKWPDIVK